MPWKGTEGYDRTLQIKSGLKDVGFVPAKSLYEKAGRNQTVADPDFLMGVGAVIQTLR